MRPASVLGLLGVVAGVLFVGIFIGLVIAKDFRDHAARRCLHGESSISGELHHGRFVVTAGPHRTGCAP